MKVITITLNPAFDLHCNSKKFEMHRENLLDITKVDAGGKGINISRTLTALGVSNKAFVVLGSVNKSEFLDKLKSYNINIETVETPGKIRENITVHENGKETRLSFKGFEADDSIIDKLEEKVIKEIDKESIVTFTGSIPKGITKKRIIDFLLRIKEKESKLVVDSKSISYDELLTLKPWLIKPNEEEITSLTKRQVKTVQEAILESKRLFEYGIENPIITFGEKGCVFATNDGIYVIKPPKTDVVSTIGAGDSFIAGFISAIVNGNNKTDAVKYAVASGTASCFKEGTTPPDRNLLNDIFKKVSLTKKIN